MNNETHWKKFEDTDPLRILFKDKGYYYTKPNACSPSQFHRTIIFHNGEKYHIIWNLVNDQWDITLVAKKDNYIFIPMGVAHTDDVAAMEDKCSAYYEHEKCVPLLTL